MSLFQVLKYRTALGRSVDLSRFDGYNDLISELDMKFDFKGSLKNGSCGWQVSYMDHEGDMMFIGDSEWELSITIITVFVLHQKKKKRITVSGSKHIFLFIFVRSGELLETFCISYMRWCCQELSLACLSWYLYMQEILFWCSKDIHLSKGRNRRPEARLTTSGICLMQRGQTCMLSFVSCLVLSDGADAAIHTMWTYAMCWTIKRTAACYQLMTWV